MKSALLLLLLLTASTSWADGVRAYQQKDWPAAWQHFEAAAQQQATPEIVWNQALTAMQMQNWQQVDELLRKPELTGYPQRMEFLRAEVAWRQCAQDVKALAPSAIEVDQVEAKHVRRLQSALRRAQQAEALWQQLGNEASWPPSAEAEGHAAAAGRNQKLAAAKAKQLEQKLKQWQQALAKKNGNKPPEQAPNQLDQNAPPPPPQQPPKMTAQDQQNLLDKLKNKQQKKVVVRERDAGQAQPGGKDW